MANMVVMTRVSSRFINLILAILALFSAGFVSSSALAKGAPHPAVTLIMALDAPLQPGEWAWDMQGVKAGDPTWVVVDLAKQKLYVYRGGTEIGRSTLIYGMDNTPTPKGNFKILSKVADKRSRTYNNAPMPWALQITKGWVAIHAAEQMDPIYATHGCIGVPPEFAKTLFQHMKVGDRVTVTRNWKPTLYPH